MNETTLKEFLRHNKAGRDQFIFAKNLTLEQFLNTCQRGNWILWLFTKTNPDSLRELTLAKAHCANTVRHLMKDERSKRAVDVAIAFGEEKATREELKDAAKAADVAVHITDSNAYWYAALSAYAAAYATNVDQGAHSCFNAAHTAADAAHAAESAEDAEKQNQKQTADICRKYLPLEIWDQNLI